MPVNREELLTGISKSIEVCVPQFVSDHHGCSCGSGSSGAEPR